MTRHAMALPSGGLPMATLRCTDTWRRLIRFLCWPCEASANQGTKANVEIE